MSSSEKVISRTKRAPIPKKLRSDEDYKHWLRVKAALVQPNNQPVIRVLLIDDEQEEMISIKRLFVSSGRKDISFYHSDNVEEGIDLIKSGNFDIALIDYFIGFRRGTEVLKIITKEAIETPVIMLTGADIKHSEREVLHLGAFDFLDKNELSHGLLTRSIDFAIRRHDVEAKLRASEANLAIARQEAEVADRAKTTFMAHMSHELRTPLNAIIGFSEIIKEDLLSVGISETYKEYAGDVYCSGQHLLSLINDILDVSKMKQVSLI